MTPNNSQVISDKLEKEWEPKMAKFVTFKPVESEKLNKSEPVLKYKLLTSKAYPPTRETPGSI